MADSSATAQFGHYIGELIFKPLGDGRLMRLVNPYEFIDGTGVDWPVPKEIDIDGASIPPILWSVIGGPFEGKYREASVIHDYYCDVHLRTWQATHEVFYNGMRASGVSGLQAKIMYAGVYFGGPRWSPSPGAAAAATPHPGAKGLVGKPVSAFAKAMKGAIALRPPAPVTHAQMGLAAAVSRNRTYTMTLSTMKSAIRAHDPSLDEIRQSIDSATPGVDNQHDRRVLFRKSGTA